MSENIDNGTPVKSVHTPSWKILAFAIFTIIASVILTIFLFKNLQSQSTTSIANQFTLEQEKVAYIQETGQIAFINRKTNTLDLILSTDMTTAVFSTKALAIQQDYATTTNATTPIATPTKKPNGKKLASDAAKSQTSQ